ncbi:MAG: HAD-IC family P-type ATPase [bacterium]|nr:HAD-IC family P-type ATPase [bacterium]
MPASKLHGLSAAEVLARRREFGQNVLPEKPGPSHLALFLNQFRSPLIYILLVVIAVSAVFGEWAEVGLISAVVLVNVFLGFYQEDSAQKTLTALKKVVKPKAWVMRVGQRLEVETRELVPGDVVLLIAGDRIPADGDFVEGTNFLVQEAILTGEEEAVAKSILAPDNRLFLGTTVLAGRGTMVVTKTGLATEVGKIGVSLGEIVKEKTVLEKKLAKFSQTLAIFILLVSLAVFAIGVGYRQDWWPTLKMAVILAVAAIPEGLPIALTMILSLGMRRILQRNGLVKNLMAMETLSSTSVICTDKTGTLTEGKMQVVRTSFVDQEKMLWAIALTNNQRTNVEVSLWEFATKQKADGWQQDYDGAERLYEIPFDSERKYALTVQKLQGRETAFIVGAPEIVLELCRQTEEEKRKRLGEVEVWAKEGLRVLGAAYKEDGDLRHVGDFGWLGLTGLADPLRPEAKEAIALCRQAGIKPVIVTGDYRHTAESVARNLGFALPVGSVLEGKELEVLGDAELRERVGSIELFTRVTPHQKLRIVTALQERGEVVAMTGDGVNDALALKKADIGVVVGNASDVAKEVADLILLDSNFQTIVAAVEEGRLILDNLKRAIGYMLADSFSEVVVVVGALLAQLPLPLTIAQILWVHLICDGPIDVLLGFEPKEKDLMRRSPQAIQAERFFDGRARVMVGTISLVVGLFSLLFFHNFLRGTGSLELAQTLAFATIASGSLIFIFAFKSRFFGNKYLWWGLVYGWLLVLVAIYSPLMNHLLGTQPLSLAHWFLVLTPGLLSALAVGIIRAVK